MLSFVGLTSRGRPPFIFNGPFIDAGYDFYSLYYSHSFLGYGYSSIFATAYSVKTAASFSFCC